MRLRLRPLDSQLRRLLADPGLPVLNPSKSFWQTAPHLPIGASQSKVLPETRDVVILGSGITGCSVAQWLLREDDALSVSVLDARGLCSGATGRNGGHIRCVAVQDYDRLSKKYGHEAAVKIVRFSLRHYESVAAAAHELGGDVLEDSELREVQSVSAVFDEKKMEEMRGMYARFEAAFPDLKGQWSICEPEEAAKVSKKKKIFLWFPSVSSFNSMYADFKSRNMALLVPLVPSSAERLLRGHTD